MSYSLEVFASQGILETNKMFLRVLCASSEAGVRYFKMKYVVIPRCRLEKLTRPENSATIKKITQIDRNGSVTIPTTMARKNKQLGSRRENILAMSPEERMRQAGAWLKTVKKIRGSDRVCKTGLYKFRTFEEADQWMETMIVAAIQESQP